MTQRLVAIAVLAVVISGCAAARPSLQPGAIAVPTDDNIVEAAGTGMVCTAEGLVPPLGGELEGDSSDLAWPVWLRADDGRLIYVVWPRGFSARFDPNATLLDETGAPIVRAGSMVRLQKTSPGEVGTRDHPCLADRLWAAGRCYVQKSPPDKRMRPGGRWPPGREK